MRVTVVSTIASQPPMIGDEPRRQADVFIELVELRAKIGSHPSERPPPRERESRYDTQQLPEHQTAAGPKGNDSVLEN